MNQQQRTATILAFLASLALSGCGAGQLFGPTLTPTLTPTVTSTPTRTPLPTPTKNPLPPLSMAAESCSSMEQDSSIGMGRIVLVKGNLTIPAGSYSLTADHYHIWLTKSPFIGDDQVRLDVVISGGKKPNSMFFDNHDAPRIMDFEGTILGWKTQPGKYEPEEVYKSYMYIIVTGTWMGKCPLVIDKIETTTVG